MSLLQQIQESVVEEGADLKRKFIAPVITQGKSSALAQRTFNMGSFAQS